MSRRMSGVHKNADQSERMIEGWPKKKGLYRCSVDGKEMVLHHHFCEMNHRHWWTDTSGYDVIADVILHDPEPIVAQKTR